MQVTLTVKEGRKFLKSFPVNSLPTCIFDLARDAATSCCDAGSGSADDEGISSMDIADLNITLDLVCMMQSEPVVKDEGGGGGGGPFSRRDGTRHISLTSNLSDQKAPSVNVHEIFPSHTVL